MDTSGNDRDMKQLIAGEFSKLRNCVKESFSKASTELDKKFIETDIKMKLTELFTGSTLDLRKKCTKEIAESTTMLQKKFEDVSKSVADELEVKLRTAFTKYIIELKKNVSKFKSKIEERFEEVADKFKLAGFEIETSEQITNYISKLYNKYRKYISEIYKKVEEMLQGFKAVNGNYKKMIQSFEDNEISKITEETREKLSKILYHVEEMEKKINALPLTPSNKPNLSGKPEVKDTKREHVIGSPIIKSRSSKIEISKELLNKNQRSDNNSNKINRKVIQGVEISAQSKSEVVKLRDYEDVSCSDENTDSEDSASDYSSDTEIEEIDYENIRPCRKVIDDDVIDSVNQKKENESPKDPPSNTIHHPPSIAGVSNFQDEKETTSEDKTAEQKQVNADENGSDEESSSSFVFIENSSAEPPRPSSDSESYSDESFEVVEEEDCDGYECVVENGPYRRRLSAVPPGRKNTTHLRYY